MSRLPIETAGTLQLTCREDRPWSGWWIGQPLAAARRSTRGWLPSARRYCLAMA